MAFIFASTSALDKLFQQRAAALRSTVNAESLQTNSGPPIRRPYRGIQIKDDTYATMQIVNGAGQIIPLVSESYTGAERPAGGKGQVEIYADFILQQITEERVEKQQIIETFGDSFIFFFGERPRMLTIRGILVNTEDFGWRAQFMYNYENFLRGSRLVQQNARMFLAWDTIVVAGYPINVTASESGDNPYVVDFQMQIFLTDYNDFGRIGVIDFPNPPRTGEELEAINRDLAHANSFISTTTEVRRMNFESRPSGFMGLGDALRAGIRAFNSVTSTLSGTFQDLSTILSGRVVRKPLGIAGFINQVGQGGIVGSGVTQGLIDEFGFGGLTDTKLTVLRRPQFVIQSPELLNARISANFDEYPLTESFGPSGALAGLGHSLTLAQTLAQTERRATRELAAATNAVELVVANTLAQSEAGVLQTIADVIQITKLGFAIFNTTRAVLNDPVAVAEGSLGLEGIGGVV